MLYVYGISFPKWSILFLYLRIFVSTSFRRVVTVILFIKVLQVIAYTIAIGVQCLPIQSLWDHTIQKKCLSVRAMIYSGAIISILDDIVIMILPAWPLRVLRINPQKKIMIGLLFAMGSLYVSCSASYLEVLTSVCSACITGMIRIRYIVVFGFTVDASCELTSDHHLLVTPAFFSKTYILCRGQRQRDSMVPDRNVHGYDLRMPLLPSASTPTVVSFNFHYLEPPSLG